MEVLPDALITNNLSKSIKTITYRSCKQSQERWLTLEKTSIAVGATLKLALPEECVDLQAIASDGRIVGTQLSVKRQYPFRWKIY